MASDGAVISGQVVASGDAVTAGHVVAAGGAVASGRVVVVGASVGGSRLAAGLREAGHTGEVVLVDPDPDAPYDRPPLSKQILAGDWDAGRASLGDPAQWGAERRVAAATHLDTTDRVLRLDDGTRLGYDRLVLACGAAPRPLPGMPRGGVHVLRTLADCHGLRADLDRVGRLVVVGGGFIGAEVASTARARGIEVTVVEALPAPLSGLLGEDVAAELALLHADNGVRLLTGTSVASLVGEPSVTGVALTDGGVLPADAVVVGIGVRPNTGWLAGSGVALHADGGVLCDAYGAAVADRTVYAVGDVARWHDPLLDRHVRVEHWTNAVEQADAVARSIAGPEPAPFRHAFFVWSDQYGGKITLLGRPDPDDEVTVVRAGGERRRFAVAYRRGARLAAVLTVNWPKALVVARRSLSAHADADDVVAAWKHL
ncbi:NAD(P)/FAD-dependent oxidoreductase [Streptomyces griseoloalbus]|uniref:NADPH-dependent 2,4-dienoyl-CoA reductase/sulfur reductase-like enzyme n=1 Tax=Streptomyces griseoloalbus TaxID=67303 RepID=A0A7W8BWB0_9ACTN|nr:FAD/NAD(P)-binding oxidoreductase [Streptomyces albaduncus]MBB5128864.1 NADPH-dependent 2,4-dienoyl-CoA reductase/sulfur reductase-like enzyme [Streptomyces albaduncus]